MKRITVAIVFAGLFAASTAFGLEVDPALPDYKKVSGISGIMKSVGSDTLNNLMTLWSEGFRSLYPGVPGTLAIHPLRCGLAQP